MATIEDLLQEIIKLKTTQRELIEATRIMRACILGLAEMLKEILVLPRRDNIERLTEILSSIREVRR